MKHSEKALKQYVDELNGAKRRIKIYLDYAGDDLLSVKIRTSGTIMTEVKPKTLDQDIQEWSHSTMRITAIDTHIGFIDIAVASNRNNYSPDLVTYTLKKLFGED